MAAGGDAAQVQTLGEAAALLNKEGDRFVIAIADRFLKYGTPPRAPGTAPEPQGRPGRPMTWTRCRACQGPQTTTQVIIYLISTTDTVING
jgi:hypothetical protein